MTIVNSIEVGPEQEILIGIITRPNGGAALTIDVSNLLPDPPQPPPMLVGMEGPNGQPTRDIVAQYGPKYMRDFGVKLTGETEPSLTPEGTGKLADMPADCTPHVSWKSDVTRLSTWLDGLTRPVYLTWKHEPMGDIAPADYRTNAAKIQPMIENHPNGHLILGHGPILTRYWLDEGNGNPLDWWYPGANIIGIDWYEPTTTYRGAPALRAALDKTRTALPNVRVLVPEYGLLVGGAGRADAIRRDVEFFRSEGVEAIGYWNSYVTDSKAPSGIRDYRITWGTSESEVWRSLAA